MPVLPRTGSLHDHHLNSGTQNWTLHAWAFISIILISLGAALITGSAVSTRAPGWFGYTILYDLCIRYSFHLLTIGAEAVPGLNGVSSCTATILFQRIAVQFWYRRSKMSFATNLLRVICAVIPGLISSSLPKTNLLQAILWRGMEI